jgi:hypothetical protein
MSDTDSTCCKFNVQSEPTLCNTTIDEAWYSQKCVCDDSLSGSGCDISNCYGSPLFFTFTCGCSTNQSLTAEDWKVAFWPEADDTRFRNFSCCSLTWSRLINKTSPDDWELLAVEVIAVKLNIMSGVCPNQISDYLESAETLLTYCTWSTEQLEESQDLLTNLRNFNSNNFKKNNHLSSANEDDANRNTILNSASLTLLLSILIPGIILTIIAITVVVIYIKKKRQQQQNQVPL